MKHHGIGEFSKTLNVSRRTLRYYEEVGVLAPKFRGENNYRYYDDNDLTRMQAVLVMKKAGLSLKEVLEALGPAKKAQENFGHGRDLAKTLESRLHKQKSKLEKKIEELLKAKSIVEASMDSLHSCLECHDSLNLEECAKCLKGCPEVVAFAASRSS